ncbi:leukemia-associated protein 7 [Xenopus laevis]|uniref:Leukemia-associated protein 7 n=2 Tax=Xenopus laevis TaxID=8355 RepID=A0A1L8HAH5_XENLA|nr:leukemia-associated protein 7 [Xenopus laevis]OCT93056.1 hypothetical protein XELAEV_18016123mg [Xenopus laevis]
MQRPGIVGVALNHQDTAFNTLRALQQDRRSEPCALIAEVNLLPSTAMNGECAGEGASSGRTRTAREMQADSTNSSSPATVSASNPRRTPSSAGSKGPTLAQMASQNRLSRVTNSTAQLLLVEQNVLQHLPPERPLLIQLKDSIEFRNICTHMALQVEDRKFDKDVSEAQQCLRTIITDLITALSALHLEFCEAATEDLRSILKNLTET